MKNLYVLLPLFLLLTVTLMIGVGNAETTILFDGEIHSTSNPNAESCMEGTFWQSNTYINGSDHYQIQLSLSMRRTVGSELVFAEIHFYNNTSAAEEVLDGSRISIDSASWTVNQTSFLDIPSEADWIEICGFIGGQGTTGQFRGIMQIIRNPDDQSLVPNVVLPSEASPRFVMDFNALIFSTGVPLFLIAGLVMFTTIKKNKEKKNNHG